MTDQFHVDVTMSFNDDETVNIEFKNVAFDDVQYIFTPEFGEDFITGLINNTVQRGL